MANFSDLTRKDQVLEYLKARVGYWVDGSELANEVVGGSEGLKRLRELKQEGWMIQMRQHPDKGVDQYQYRMAEQMRVVDEPTPLPNMPAAVAERPAPSYQPPRGDPYGPGPKRGRETEPKWGQWELKNPVTGERHIVYWIGKQRLVGMVMSDGVRWFWVLKLPAYNPKKGMPRKEHKWAGSAADMDAAKDAVHVQLQKLREEGLPND